MKKTVLFVFTLCASFLFIKCDTEQETLIEIDNKKSLNQENKLEQDISLEEWVENNYEVLSTYSRVEISSYSKTVQKAILRSFPPKKIKEIWQSKIDYLLSSSDFSKNEKKYFQWFAKKFENLSYDKAFDKNLSQEMYEKAIAGIDKFGWSKTDVYKMFFTIGNLNTDDNQQKRAVLTQYPGDDTNGTWCECYYDISCPGWDCDSGANCDNSGDSPHDCGVFGGTDCDGNC